MPDFDDIDSFRSFGSIEVKYNDDAGQIEGYAATFNDAPCTYGDVIAPGAFSETLAGHRKAGTSPAMLWSHQQSRPVGKWTDLSERPKGLYVKGQLNLGTSAGREARGHLTHGDVSGLSIGFRVGKGDRETRGDGTRLIKRAALDEISLVTLPAMENARVTSVKARITLNSKAELEDMLRSGGLSRAAATRIANKGWSGLMSDDDDRQGQDQQFEKQQDEATARLIRRLAEQTRELKTLKGN